MSIDTGRDTTDPDSPRAYRDADPLDTIRSRIERLETRIERLETRIERLEIRHDS